MLTKETYSTLPRLNLKICIPNELKASEICSDFPPKRLHCQDIFPLLYGDLRKYGYATLLNQKP